jgi:hypothetical protein
MKAKDNAFMFSSIAIGIEHLLGYSYRKDT